MNVGRVASWQRSTTVWMAALSSFSMGSGWVAGGSRIRLRLAFFLPWRGGA